MGEKAWLPTSDDVDELEAALPRAISQTRQARQVNFNHLLERWRRQYVGIVRGGARFIYGNFFPTDTGDDFQRGWWPKQKVLACDGGPRFFGVEFEVSTRRITRIDFNGTVGGPS